MGRDKGVREAAKSTSTEALCETEASRRRCHLCSFEVDTENEEHISGGGRGLGRSAAPTRLPAPAGGGDNGPLLRRRPLHPLRKVAIPHCLRDAVSGEGAQDVAPGAGRRKQVVGREFTLGGPDAPSPALPSVPPPLPPMMCLLPAEVNQGEDQGAPATAVCTQRQGPEKAAALPGMRRWDAGRCRSRQASAEADTGGAPAGSSAATIGGGSPQQHKRGGAASCWKEAHRRRAQGAREAARSTGSGVAAAEAAALGVWGARAVAGGAGVPSAASASAASASAATYPAVLIASRCEGRGHDRVPVRLPFCPPPPTLAVDPYRCAEIGLTVATVSRTTVCSAIAR